MGNIVKLLFALSFIGQFVNPVGGEGDGVKEDRFSSSLQRSLYLKKNKIIWCKIQVIINPLSKHTSVKYLPVNIVHAKTGQKRS